MLELVINRYEKNEFKPTDAIDESQSHLFINSLIQQIKQVHSEEVWNLKMEILMSFLKQEDQRPKYLTAL